MNPVEDDPPGFRFQLRLARACLWCAAGLLLWLQFLDYFGKPLWRVWPWLFGALKQDVESAIHAGRISTAIDWELGVPFVSIHLMVIAAPWLERVLVRHTLLRWVARGTGIAFCGGYVCMFCGPLLGMLVPRFYPWLVVSVLSSVLTATGLCLLPGRKNTASLIPPGLDAQNPATTCDEPGRS